MIATNVKRSSVRSQRRPAARKAARPPALALETIDLDYMYNPTFRSPSAEQTLFADSGDELEVRFRPQPVDLRGEEVPPDARRRTLKAPEQTTLFLRYNYARYRLSRLLSGRDSGAGSARHKALWFERARQARASLIHGNMALVLAMAKRAGIPNVEFEDLVSEGNIALMKCVDKFDVARGFRFSTYACSAILRRFSRLARKATTYHQRFPVGYDPELEQNDRAAWRHDRQWADSVEYVKDVLAGRRGEISPLEQTIIIERFGLSRQGRARTLADIARIVALSVERTRQILNQALAKLRVSLEGGDVAA